MKRRSFIQAFPFIGAAVAIPVTAAEVGSSLDAETTALVSHWQQLLAEQQALASTIKALGIRAMGNVDHPMLLRQSCLDSDVNEAQHAVTRALRKAGA